MKKQLTLGLLGLSTCAFGQDQEEQKHCFTPKFFYRYHDEINYKYDTWGVGIEYHLKRPEGMNAKVSLNTNIDSTHPLAEITSSLFFKIKLDGFNYLYPILSWKNDSHKIRDDETSAQYINKSIGFCGIGWEYEDELGIAFRVEVEGFRDIHNILLTKEGSKMYGRSYWNPFGGRGKIGLTKSWENKYFLDLEGFYAQTFQKCYKECGVVLSAKWGF